MPGKKLVRNLISKLDISGKRVSIARVEAVIHGQLTSQPDCRPSCPACPSLPPGNSM